MKAMVGSLDFAEMDFAVQDTQQIEFIVNGDTIILWNFLEQFMWSQKIEGLLSTLFELD